VLKKPRHDVISGVPMHVVRVSRPRGRWAPFPRIARSRGGSWPRRCIPRRVLQIRRGAEPAPLLQP